MIQRWNRQFGALQCLRPHPRQRPIIVSMAYFYLLTTRRWSLLWTVHNSCNVKRGSFTAGYGNQTVPRSSRCAGTLVFKFGAASFTSPSIFPAASLQGTNNHTLPLPDVYFSRKFQHPFPANVLNFSKMMNIFGILRETLGNPPKKNIPIPTIPISHGLGALHQRFRLHLRVGRGGHRCHRCRRCRRRKCRATFLRVWVAVHTWISPCGVGIESQMLCTWHVKFDLDHIQKCWDVMSYFVQQQWLLTIGFQALGLRLVPSLLAKPKSGTGTRTKTRIRKHCCWIAKLA